MDPDILVADPVAISTRVAPSFIRVGQLELFGRRARNKAHPKAMEELEKIMLHLVDREYSGVIDNQLSTAEKVVVLAREFRGRLTSLIANWIRVGYCQGNFNSDNCAAGGFTLDYGPFGFMDAYNPNYQSWTGGGHHFSFLNQSVAAERNFQMFCKALSPLLASDQACQQQLDELQRDFAKVMQTQMEKMWAAKLGLSHFDADLFNELETLMQQTPVDYTMFFRELSMVPDDIASLQKSFYKDSQYAMASMSSKYRENPTAMDQRWTQWLTKWHSLNAASTDSNTAQAQTREELSKQMKLVNPKYSWREWLVVPAYQQAATGSYALIQELQKVMTQPYAEQSNDVAEKYYRLKPAEFFEVGGLSHYSCSS
jgi:uncharacterized protein YdiU (UPF0061 family)